MLKYIAAALIILPLFSAAGEYLKRKRARAAALLSVARLLSFCRCGLEEDKASPDKIIAKYEKEGPSAEMTLIIKDRGIGDKHPWACLLSEGERNELASFLGDLGLSSLNNEIKRCAEAEKRFSALAASADGEACKDSRVVPLLLAALGAGILILLL